jgi:hypothetical protein
MRCWLSFIALGSMLLLLPSVSLGAAASRLLPTDEVAGWVLRETPRIFGTENLYEYIDGNADLFLAYGFTEAAVGDYLPTEGEGWISVDLYDMGAPLHAFGIYQAEKPEDVEALTLGAQSYRSEGLIAFWKGAWYVKVSLIDGDDASAALRLAQAAAARIGGTTALPTQLDRLPTQNRVPGSERYIRQGALGHRFLNEVVSAAYSFGKVNARLYIADLATSEQASQGYDKLRAFEDSAGGNLADVASLGEEAFAVRDSYYGQMVVARRGRYVAIAASETADRSRLGDLVKAAVSPPKPGEAKGAKPAG